MGSATGSVTGQAMGSAMVVAELASDVARAVGVAGASRSGQAAVMGAGRIGGDRCGAGAGRGDGDGAAGAGAADVCGSGRGCGAGRPGGGSGCGVVGAGAVGVGGGGRGCGAVRPGGGSGCGKRSVRASGASRGGGERAGRVRLPPGESWDRIEIVQIVRRKDCAWERRGGHGVAGRTCARARGRDDAVRGWVSVRGAADGGAVWQHQRLTGMGRDSPFGKHPAWRCVTGPITCWCVCGRVGAWASVRVETRSCELEVLGTRARGPWASAPQGLCDRVQ